MWLISILIILGALLLIAELVLLPGITIAGIGSLACYCGAVYLSYTTYGPGGMGIAIVVVATISLLATWFSLRSKTWHRLSLKSKIDGTSQTAPANLVKIGDRGVAITRLAPSGKVMVGGQTFEARSIDTYVDPQTEVEVTGFDNFNIIVKILN